jgi:hypothetical protein
MDLDEEYLGERLPGTEIERRMLLESLQEALDDPERGPEWVRKERQFLLRQWKYMVSEGLMGAFLAKPGEVEATHNLFSVRKLKDEEDQEQDEDEENWEEYLYPVKN